jgi:hypothetical protein
MIYRVARITALLALCGLQGRLAAATVERQVNPQFMLDNPSLFKLTVTKRDNGLFRFEVTRAANDHDWYRVATVRLRKKSNTLAEISCPSFVLRDVQTIYVDVLPEMIAESRLVLSDRSFQTSNGEKTPLPGGIDYVIQLRDFAVDPDP